MVIITQFYVTMHLKFQQDESEKELREKRKKQLNNKTPALQMVKVKG